jgi:hypothetical protein
MERGGPAGARACGVPPDHDAGPWPGSTRCSSGRRVRRGHPLDSDPPGGRSSATPSQTAWVPRYISGGTAEGLSTRRAASIFSSSASDGDWDEQHHTGTGFTLI